MEGSAMPQMDRREFLGIGARAAALFGLGAAAVPRMAGAAETLVRRPPVLWLQGQSCSGCSVSLLDSDPLGPDRLVTDTISLVFHQTLSAATGHTAVEVVNRAVGEGGYILAVEGAVPSAMPDACRFGPDTFEGQLSRAAAKARAVLAVGACAAFGGIPAAEGNPTGAVSVPAHLRKAGITTPAILVPGCPVHPDWLVGTIVHVLGFGIPPLTELGVPKAFFSTTIHDQCPRFADYEREKFAKSFSDRGCLFRLGCQGPLTKSDCTLRPFNSGTNSCIRSGAPCIGCVSPGFAASAGFPFYTPDRAKPSSKGNEA